MSYTVLFTTEAGSMLDALDKSVRVRLIKKIAKMERKDLPSRHLKAGLPHFVEESGGYRIVFEMEGKTKLVVFVGDHKQYENWYSQA
ncbi:MAG: hypothetical protein V1708_05735 [Candidatus Micrarchaeota archaeon]